MLNARSKPTVKRQSAQSPSSQSPVANFVMVVWSIGPFCLRISKFVATRQRAGVTEARRAGGMRRSREGRNTDDGLPTVSYEYEYEYKPVLKGGRRGRRSDEW